MEKINSYTIRLDPVDVNWIKKELETIKPNILNNNRCACDISPDIRLEIEYDIFFDSKKQKVYLHQHDFYLTAVDKETLQTVRISNTESCQDKLIQLTRMLVFGGDVPYDRA